jgi:hypothetical protein
MPRITDALAKQLMRTDPRIHPLLADDANTQRIAAMLNCRWQVVDLWLCRHERNRFEPGQPVEFWADGCGYTKECECSACSAALIARAWYRLTLFADHKIKSRLYPKEVRHLLHQLVLVRERYQLASLAEYERMTTAEQHAELRSFRERMIPHVVLDLPTFLA